MIRKMSLIFAIIGGVTFFDWVLDDTFTIAQRIFIFILLLPSLILLNEVVMLASEKGFTHYPKCRRCGKKIWNLKHSKNVIGGGMMYEPGQYHEKCDLLAINWK